MGKFKVLEHGRYDIHTTDFNNKEEALKYAEIAYDRLTKQELKYNVIEVVKNYKEGEHNINYDIVVRMEG